MQLSDSETNAIQREIDRGDEALDDEFFAVAIEHFKKAVSLIPDPKHEFAIALHAFAALGDGYFFSGYHDDAIRAFRQALKAPGGVENGLVWLRLGQVYYELRELDAAADALTRAFALEGQCMFDDEDEKYLTFLSTRIDISES
jgi:tetratricopeptide (TPR) repeat protein